MPSVLMFKKIGGFHNALLHEVEAMKKDGWEVVEKEQPKEEPTESFDYAIHKEGWQRVVKVCDTEEQAVSYAMKKFGSMDGITIKPRPRK